VETDDRFSRARWVVPLGLGMVAFFLAEGLLATGTLRDALVGASGVFVLIAIFQGARPYLKPKDRFDLKELQRVHEREELKAIDPGEVSEFADRVVCPRCGMDYSTRFPICPHCKQ